MLSKSERTKIFIIEKSAPIFNKKGYAATTMTDILKATGLAKGGIYGNFTSKDEIALEAFEYSLNKLKDELRVKIKQEKTSVDKLNAILDFFHNYSVSPHTEGGCPILNTAIDSDDSIPFLKERALKGLKELQNSYTHIIEQGIKYGEFKSTLNPSEEAELILATIEGGIMMSKLNDNPETLNRLLENIRTQIKIRFLK
jgi:TetR/AcrR family transcriptional repressor of nem operon